VYFRTCYGRPTGQVGTFYRELRKNGWTDRFAVWVVDSGGPKEAWVQSYSPGGANVPTWEGTLALPGEYDWTVRLRRRWGLSNYFHHLLFWHFTKTNESFETVLLLKTNNLLIRENSFLVVCKLSKVWINFGWFYVFLFDDRLRCTRLSGTSQQNNVLTYLYLY